MTEHDNGLRISVMLAVPDATSASAWYQHALGATELWSLASVVGLAPAAPLAHRPYLRPELAAAGELAKCVGSMHTGVTQDARLPRRHATTGLRQSRIRAGTSSKC